MTNRVEMLKLFAIGVVCQLLFNIQYSENLENSSWNGTYTFKIK